MKTENIRINYKDGSLETITDVIVWALNTEGNLLKLERKDGERKYIPLAGNVQGFTVWSDAPDTTKKGWV